jgi:hypothetical protein
MGKGLKANNAGGDKREIECPCGFSTKGSVREANFKMKLHVKICNGVNIESNKFPNFDKIISSKNGLVEFDAKTKTKKISFMANVK